MFSLISALGMPMKAAPFQPAGSGRPAFAAPGRDGEPSMLQQALEPL
jgi:hypothetical protein